MTSNKRRIKRIAVELPVMVYLFNSRINKRLGEPLAGSIKNFSPMGAALNVVSIMLQGKHLFYTCQDNPDIVLELVFEPSSSPGKTITVRARPAWFDWDIESERKQFVVGLKFLANTRSTEIKILSREACRDEKRLVSLWRKLF